MNNKEKTRNIPFCEYFDNLQREYIVAELRYKIYPRERDKSYYRDREMMGKRKTIEDISLRNNLSNIFNSPEKYKKFKSEIYNEIGLPNFIYRNEEDRAKRRPQDIINYFYRDIEVSYYEGDSLVRGKILYTDVVKKVCSVKKSETKTTCEVPFDKIIRHNI